MVMFADRPQHVPPTIAETGYTDPSICNNPSVGRVFTRQRPSFPMLSSLVFVTKG